MGLLCNLVLTLAAYVELPKCISHFPFCFLPIFFFPLFSNSHLSPLPPQTHTRADGRLCKPLSGMTGVRKSLHCTENITCVHTDRYVFNTNTHTISIRTSRSLLWPFEHLLCNTEKGQGETDRKRMSERDGCGRVWKHYVTPVGGAGLQVWRLSLLLRPGALVSSEIIAHCLLPVHTHNTNCARVWESAAYGGANSAVIMKPYMYKDK